MADAKSGLGAGRNVELIFLSIRSAPPPVSLLVKPLVHATGATAARFLINQPAFPPPSYSVLHSPCSSSLPPPADFRRIRIRISSSRLRSEYRNCTKRQERGNRTEISGKQAAVCVLSPGNDPGSDPSAEGTHTMYGVSMQHFPFGDHAILINRIKLKNLL